MWLRDALPYDMRSHGHENPPARVMVYGYGSRLAHSQSVQNLEDLGTSFRTSLSCLASAPTVKPIILIAHSLGGLVAKQVRDMSLTKPVV